MSSWQRSQKQIPQDLPGNVQQQQASYQYPPQYSHHQQQFQQHHQQMQSSLHDAYPSQSQTAPPISYEQMTNYNLKGSNYGANQYYATPQSRGLPLSSGQVVGASGVPLTFSHSRSPSSPHSNAGASSSASYSTSSKFDASSGTFVSPSPTLRQGISSTKSDRPETVLVEQQQQQQHPQVLLGPAPLRRGQACQACRRRKLKCDAIRPVCGTCTRSRKAAASANHISPVPDGDCVYDDVPAAPIVGAVQNEDQPSLRSNNSNKARRQSNANVSVSTSNEVIDGNKEPISSVTKKRRTTAGGDRRATISSWEDGQSKGDSSIDAQSNNEDYSLALLPGENEQEHSTRLAKRIRQLEGRLEEAQSLIMPMQSSQAKGVDASPSKPAYPSSGPAVPILSMLSPSSGKEEKYRMQYSQRPARYSQGSSLRNEVINVGSDQGRQDSTLFDFTLGATAEVDRDEQVRKVIANGHYINQDPILQLLWPGWSKDLPSPDTISAICEIFFRLHPLRTLVYKPSFMSGLSLPPKHPHRPHDSLIHAILATTADISPFYEVMTRQRQDRFVMMLSDSRSRPNEHLQSNQDEHLSFKEFHLRKARAKVEMSLITDFRNPLDWISACILSCFTLWNDFRITESYFLSAILVRACSPAGLDKLPCQHFTSKGSEPNQAPGLFGSPQGIEEHERRFALWHIFLVDQYTGGSPSFYENLLVESSISTHLPCTVSDYQAGKDVPPNTQMLDSPDLFRLGHLDDFTLHVKSAILVRRSCTLQCRHQLTKKKPAGVNVIDKHITEFITSFPSFEFDYQDQPSIDKLTAWNNISLAIFHLHEPYLTPTWISVKDSNPSSNYSVKRIHMAVDNVLNLIHQLMNTSFDFALLHPQIFLTWSVCGRMLGKDLDYIKRTGNGGEMAMQQVLGSLQWIIQALERGGEKNIKARRCSELVSYVRSGTMHEGILSQLLYTDGVIPTGDEDGTSVMPTNASFDIPLSMSNETSFSPNVATFANQSMDSMHTTNQGTDHQQQQQSMQTNYNGNDMLEIGSHAFLDWTAAAN